MMTKKRLSLIEGMLALSGPIHSYEGELIDEVKRLQKQIKKLRADTKEDKRREDFVKVFSSRET